ncbi:succinate dehydrogenase, cytochrome b556 subunit [Hoyosella sp. G463]|uniref:Succinate dehydrogenase, cytochrome b556 subunit n=1 Tax=Lolliginicoccus lacisalsi TaxID=2742202 RepID=A0A927JC76_9ACTN|nr:succinate dehydrogenase, cytochrome b556 subunit [Lolliginicoccus lacisalsi]MBD8506534.1 succinate dehydrogenase, cytochrome b556 subunit [Lolliginicoccus lacisalsi]
MTSTQDATGQVVRTRSIYRGDPGMWSWVLHRITGVTLFFFLFVHVLDTALVRVSPEMYDAVIETYKNPVVGTLELGLLGAVVYHAFNGLRVILIDFWSKGPKYQRVMFYIVLALSVAIMIPASGRIFYLLFGSL